MNKKYLYAGLFLIVTAIFIAVFVIKKDKNVLHYAEKFCSCAADLSELETQKTMGRVSPAHYESANKDFKKCLGTNVISFEKSADSAKFYDALAIEIIAKCPQVAKNMGFKIY
jgi:hypothetical protein